MLLSGFIHLVKVREATKWVHTLSSVKVREATKWVHTLSRVKVLSGYIHVSNPQPALRCAYSYTTDADIGLLHVHIRRMHVQIRRMLYTTDAFV